VQRIAPVCRLLGGDFEVFCTTGATRCTDWGEIWHKGVDQRLTPPRNDEFEKETGKKKFSLLRGDRIHRIRLNLASKFIPYVYDEIWHGRVYYGPAVTCQI